MVPCRSAGAGAGTGVPVPGNANTPHQVFISVIQSITRIIFIHSKEITAIPVEKVAIYQ